jgi:hypothetical protein
VTEIKVASLNLCWSADAKMRARQRDVLMAGDFDVAMLQEVRSKDLSLLRSEFDWTCHSLDAQASFRDLGVAILGRKGTSLVAHQQLPAQAFVNSDVYEELAAWFHQRHLVVDVSVPGGGMVRMMSAHATPATSRGPGNPKRGVGARKPWFHTTLALWICQWNLPYLFAIDANTPRTDTADWATTQFWWPSDGKGGPGEDVLLGPPDRRLHSARDLWHDWLHLPQGALDRQRVPDDGPLARSHSTGGNWRRYDHLYATKDITPLSMSYAWDPTVSDHSLVSVVVSLD